MDDELIHQINSMVGENDILWHLGDFSMHHHSDRGYYQRCRGIRDRIRCKNINIIWGNHDDFEIRDLFGEAYGLKDLRIQGGPMIVLCHYAMAVWNKSHRGSFHLYGHSHSSAEPWLEENMPGRKSMDAGVDNAALILGAYRPWSYAEILDIFSKRSGHSMDHHKPRR